MTAPLLHSHPPSETLATGRTHTTVSRHIAHVRLSQDPRPKPRYTGLGMRLDLTRVAMTEEQGEGPHLDAGEQLVEEVGEDIALQRVELKGPCSEGREEDRVSCGDYQL